MKIYPLLLIVWGLLCIGAKPTHAQYSVSVAGGNGAGSGGSISFTVGQIDYLTITATIGSVAQGVQQPFEIFQYVAIEKPDPESTNWQIFPNPATDFVIIRSDNPAILTKGDFSCQIFDISGKILTNNEIHDSETTILFSGWSPGVYLLRISTGNNTVNNYCIIIK